MSSSPYMNYTGHSGAVVDISWSKSSMTFVSAGSDNQAILWRISNPEPIRRFSHP